MNVPLNKIPNLALLPNKFNDDSPFLEITLKNKKVIKCFLFLRVGNHDSGFALIVADSRSKFKEFNKIKGADEIALKDSENLIYESDIEKIKFLNSAKYAKYLEDVWLK